MRRRGYVDHHYHGCHNPTHLDCRPDDNHYHHDCDHYSEAHRHYNGDIHDHNYHHNHTARC
jgi:hypothetical protein